MKFVEIDLDEDHPEPSLEEFEKMNNSQRRDVVIRSLNMMKKRMFLISAALLRFGKHDPSCTDENVCNCGYSPVESLAMSLMDALHDDVGAKDLDPEKLN